MLKLVDSYEFSLNQLFFCVLWHFHLPRIKIYRRAANEKLYYTFFMISLLLLAGSFLFRGRMVICVFGARHLRLFVCGSLSVFRRKSASKSNEICIIKIVKLLCE